MIVVILIYFAFALIILSAVRGAREAERQRAQLERATLSGHSIATAMRRRGAL